MDWGDGSLHKDIAVNHIFTRLNFSSRVRAAATCSGWRQLARLAGPSQLDVPWLWLSTPSSIDESLIHLRSAAKYRPLGTPTRARAIGSYGQYILHAVRVSSGKEFIKIVLSNPFTGQSFHLPPLPHSPETGVRIGRLSSIPANPTSYKDCLVAVAFDTNLFVCRLGDQGWSPPLELPNIQDLLFYKANLYCVDHGGRIFSVNNVHLLPDISLTPIIVLGDENGEEEEGDEDGEEEEGDEDENEKDHYLVESCGELLFVTAHYVPNLDFSVQRLEPNEPMLVNVDGLGDRMLLVGWGCSTSGFNVHMTPEEFFTKNCIYFINRKGMKADGVSIGKYNLDTKEVDFMFIVCQPNILFSNFWPLWINP